MNKIQAYLYSFLCILLLLAESLFISLQVDAKLVPDGQFSWLLIHMGDLLRWLTISTAIFISLIYCFKKDLLQEAIPTLIASIFYWVLHLACYTGLFFTSIQLFNPESLSTPTWLSLLWMTLMVLSLLTWARLLHPLAYISQFIKSNLTHLLVGGAIGFLLIQLTIHAGNLWEPLSLITLHGSSALLSLFFADDVFVDVPNKLLGVKEFVVHIAPACSGLEGLITSLGVTGIYLLALRKELVFPVAFLLLPIAIILSIILNIVRIAVLLTIGVFISPDIAVEGFHSVAGWISAAIVAFFVIFVFSSLTVFNKANHQNTNEEIKQTGDSDLAWAILIPFILILIVSLLSQIVIDGFNYLYPLKVIVGLSALFYFWKQYQLKLPQQWLEPIIGGLVVAILWIILVPENPEYDLYFIFSLTDMTEGFIIAWFIFRFIGFWVMAPIVEELIFRGYMLSRLSKQQIVLNQPITLSMIPLIISSLIFGIMHNAFVAGLIAGIIFAIIRYRSNSISEPILAHLIANMGVAIWAIYTERWVLL